MNLSYNVSYCVAAIIIDVLLIVAVLFHYSSTNLVNRRYRFFLYGSVAMFTLDLVTVFTIDNANSVPPWANVLLNSLYFASGALVGLLFLYYCTSLALKESAPTHRKLVYLINLIVLGVYVLVLVANAPLGFFFSFKPTYTHGGAYLLVNLLALLYVIEAGILFIWKRRNFNKRQILTTALFFASFFVSFGLQLFVFKDVLLSSFGCALGSLMVFFSLETPDYVKLVATLEELNELKASLEIQVENRTNELHQEKKSYEELTVETLSTLADVIDAKDHYTNGHSFRVAAYSRAIALELGMSGDEAEKIYLAGLIHDVGKIGINETILAKPGKLTEEEFALIKAHSKLGGDILRGIKEFPIFEQVARSHHERYDGLGYPDKLKGEEIPYPARIVSVADTYDAMTSDRSYRKALKDEVALKELRDCSGTQFDPAIVAAFLALCAHYRDSIRGHVSELAIASKHSKGA